MKLTKEQAAMAERCTPFYGELEDEYEDRPTQKEMDQALKQVEWDQEELPF